MNIVNADTSISLAAKANLTQADAAVLAELRTRLQAGRSKFSRFADIGPTTIGMATNHAGGDAIEGLPSADTEEPDHHGSAAGITGGSALRPAPQKQVPSGKFTEKLARQRGHTTPAAPVSATGSDPLQRGTK